MKTIYIVRHAKADGQPREAKLTEEGLKQSKQLQHFFQDKPVDYIFTSPFLRALDTISPLANSRDIQITQDDRLAERVLSHLELPDWKEKLRASFEDFDLVLAGGESNRSGYERAISIIEEIIHSDYDSVILVTHGNLMTLLLRYFNENVGYEELLSLSNPDVYEVTVDEKQGNVKRIWNQN